MSSYRIAVIAGDGIGKEVMPEGVRVLDAVGRKFGIAFTFDEFDWSCDKYETHGWWMPPDWRDQIGNHDCIFFGATGWPAIVPDHKSLWDSLIHFRRDFDQYVNLRPVRLMPGITCPLVGRKLGDIDYLVIRENTEGEYSSVGGRMFIGSERETVTQTSVFTRRGVDRIMKYAFELATTRPEKHVTSATKSNGIAITMPYWDERFKEMAEHYPGIKTDQFHIDGLMIQLVLNPQRFDVIVASNLSGNINPDRTFPSLFEPVHGSAPDIYGKRIANPVAQIWSGAMMLDHLGHPDAAAAIMKAIEDCLVDGPRTPDVGGNANTEDMGKAIAAAI